MTGGGVTTWANVDAGKVEKPYNITSTMVFLSFAAGSSCKIELPSETMETNGNGNSPSIVLVNWFEAAAHGCFTLDQLTPQIVEGYNPS